MAPTKLRMKCPICGSEDVLSDAYAKWSYQDQEWHLQSTFLGDGFCNDCETSISIYVVKGPEPPTEYTVFCQQVNGRGTIWIDSVQAATPASAADLGRGKCAFDWNFNPENVHVLGVAHVEDGVGLKIDIWEDLEQ